MGLEIKSLDDLKGIIQGLQAENKALNERLDSMASPETPEAETETEIESEETEELKDEEINDLEKLLFDE